MTRSAAIEAAARALVDRAWSDLINEKLVEPLRKALALPEEPAPHHACDVAFEDLTRKLAERDALLADMSEALEMECPWSPLLTRYAKMKPPGGTESLEKGPVPSTESTRGSSNEDTGSRAGDAGSTPDPRATESSSGATQDREAARSPKADPVTDGALLARVREALQGYVDGTWARDVGTSIVRTREAVRDLDAWTDRARDMASHKGSRSPEEWAEKIVDDDGAPMGPTDKMYENLVACMAQARREGYEQGYIEARELCARYADDYERAWRGAADGVPSDVASEIADKCRALKPTPRTTPAKALHDSPEGDPSCL